MGLKSGTPAQPEAQFHASVAAGGQYAALAKKASGAKESICAWERAVIDWRAESAGEGAARTRVARVVRPTLKRIERGAGIVVFQVCGGSREKAGCTRQNTTRVEILTQGGGEDAQRGRDGWRVYVGRERGHH